MENVENNSAAVSVSSSAEVTAIVVSELRIVLLENGATCSDNIVVRASPVVAAVAPLVSASRSHIRCIVLSRDTKRQTIIFCGKFMSDRLLCI